MGRAGPDVFANNLETVRRLTPAVRDAKAGAALLRIEGAPALFVDGVRIGGALPQEQLWMVIDRALRAAGVEPPAAPAQPAPAKPAGTEK